MLHYSSVSKSGLLRRAAVRRVAYVLVDVSNSLVRRLPLTVTKLSLVATRRAIDKNHHVSFSIERRHTYSTLSPSDFEIDLITLKKVPVPANPDKQVSFEFDFGKEIFVQDRYQDFYDFLKFAAPSHGATFNTLVAKVDEYALQKGANVEVLQRMKHDFSLIEEVIQYFEIARNSEIILHLQFGDLEYLMPELKVLAQEFDFNTTTIAEFTRHLDDTLAKFEIENGTFDKTPEFFQILIQCTRYKTLRGIIWSAYSKYPAVDASYGDNLHLLAKLVTNPEHSTFKDYPKQFEDFVNKNHRELLALILGYFSNNYKSIDTAEFLAGLQSIIDDKKGQLRPSREIATLVRDGILRWSGAGVIGNFQEDIIREVVHGYHGEPSKFTEDALENYEYNVINWLFGNDPSLLRLLKRLDEDFIRTISENNQVIFSKVDLDPCIVEAIQKAEEKVLEFDHTVSWGYETLENFAAEGYLPGSAAPKTEINGKEYLKGYVVDLRDIKKRYLQSRFEFSDLNIILLKTILSKYVLEKSDVSLLATIEGIFAKNPNNIEGVLCELDRAILEDNTTYNQIPPDIRLEHFTSQLSELAKEYLPSIAHGKFALCSSEEILSAIRGVLANSNKDVNELVTWNKLYGSLVKLFAQNNNHTFVLDTLLLNVEVLDNFETGKKLTPGPTVPEFASNQVKTYVQLPDDFRLDQFVSEIANMKDFLGIDSFAEVSAEEVLSACETLVAWESPRYPYINLQTNLITLFKMNNDHTAVLDNLLISQSVFDAVEKKLKGKQEMRAPVSVPTIKLDTSEILLPSMEVESALPSRAWLAESGPDMLHDIDSVEAPIYAHELIELRSKLSNGSFYKSSNQDIFETLNSMIDSCSEEQGQMKLNLRKVCYNMNGANLSNSSKLNLDRYLDGLDTENTGTELCEPATDGSFTSAPIKEMEPDITISLVGENAGLMNEYFPLVRAFLIKLSLWDKKNWGVSASKFYDLLTSFEAQLDKLAPNYIKNLEAVKHLKYYTNKIEFYPDFVQQLCEVKSFNLKKDLSVKDVETAYKVLIETSDYDADLAPILSAIDAKVGEKSHEKISDVKMDSSPKVDDSKAFEYNDSEKLLALLTKNEDGATLQDNDLFNHIIHEHDISDYYIKDAVASPAKESNANEEDKKTLYYNHPKHQNVIRKSTGVANELEPSKEIDTSTIEEFLENAKQKFEIAKEEKAKVREAYQWSKNSSASFKKSATDPEFLEKYKLPLTSTPLFPSYKDGDGANTTGTQYLLLSVDGHKIQTTEHPLGMKSPNEDIFEVLGKFRKEELDHIAKNIEELQNDGWKIVGSKVEPRAKYLVWEKIDSSKVNTSIPSSGFGRSIKNIFAGIGVILASLIGINFVLDGSNAPLATAHEKLPATLPSGPVTVTGAMPEALLQSEMAIAEDVSKLINEQEVRNKSSSALKKILWK